MPPKYCVLCGETMSISSANSYCNKCASDFCTVHKRDYASLFHLGSMRFMTEPSTDRYLLQIVCPECTRTTNK